MPDGQDTLLGIRLLVDSRRSVSLGTVIYFPFHIVRLQRSKILVASIDSTCLTRNFHDA